MSQIIPAVLTVGGTGLVFGCILAFASFIFKVEEDERTELIVKVLPGANCGGCGYAGCAAYAAAIVEGKAPLNACGVGKEAVSKKIAEIMGAEAESAEPLVASVMCVGTCDLAKEKYEDDGLADCVSANKLAGGAKACRNGCLGLGSCAKVCPFGAISVSDGVAVVDKEKCTACGKCVSTCPKHIIKLIPQKSKYVVKCSSTAAGAQTIKACSAGCIGCKMCEKNCPKSAVKVENNLAEIDYSICVGCGICAEKCPKKIIRKEEI